MGHKISEGTRQYKRDGVDFRKGPLKSTLLIWAWLKFAFTHKGFNWFLSNIYKVLHRIAQKWLL